MRILVLVLKTALFLLLLGFAAKNTESVAVRYFLGFEWQAPLAFVLFVFFAAGALAGLLANVGIVARQRREILGLKRELRSRAPPAVPAAAESA